MKRKADQKDQTSRLLSGGIPLEEILKFLSHCDVCSFKELCHETSNVEYTQYGRIAITGPVPVRYPLFQFDHVSLCLSELSDWKGRIKADTVEIIYETLCELEDYVDSKYCTGLFLAEPFLSATKLVLNQFPQGVCSKSIHSLSGHLQELVITRNCYEIWDLKTFPKLRSLNLSLSSFPNHDFSDKLFKRVDGAFSNLEDLRLVVNLEHKHIQSHLTWIQASLERSVCLKSLTLAIQLEDKYESVHHLDLSCLSKTKISNLRVASADLVFKFPTFTPSNPRIFNRVAIACPHYNTERLEDFFATTRIFWLELKDDHQLGVMEWMKVHVKNLALRYVRFYPTAYKWDYHSSLAAIQGLKQVVVTHILCMEKEEEDYERPNHQLRPDYRWQFLKTVDNPTAVKRLCTESEESKGWIHQPAKIQKIK